MATPYIEKDSERIVILSNVLFVSKTIINDKYAIAFKLGDVNNKSIYWSYDTEVLRDTAYSDIKTALDA